MKFTKQQVIRIINEEMIRIMDEASPGEEALAAIEDVPDAAGSMADKLKKDIETLVKGTGLDPVVLGTVVGAILSNSDPKALEAIEKLPKAARAMADKAGKEIDKLSEPSGLDPEVLRTAVAALISTK